MTKHELLNQLPQLLTVLTDKFKLDPGVPGGRHLVVHPAPVLAAVPRDQPLQVEVGLADPGRVLVQHVAPVSQGLVVLPVLAGTGAGPEVETGMEILKFSLINRKDIKEEIFAMMERGRLLP